MILNDVNCPIVLETNFLELCIFRQSSQNILKQELRGTSHKSRHLPHSRMYFAYNKFKLTFSSQLIYEETHICKIRLSKPASYDVRHRISVPVARTLSPVEESHLRPLMRIFNIEDLLKEQKLFGV